MREKKDIANINCEQTSLVMVLKQELELDERFGGKKKHSIIFYHIYQNMQV